MLPLRPITKHRIRIGTRISPAWLRSPNDGDLRFLKQIGVDALDIELVMVKGCWGNRLDHQAVPAQTHQDRFAPWAYASSGPTHAG